MDPRSVDFSDIITPKNLDKLKQEKSKYLERQDKIFRVFGSPEGQEVLGMLREASTPKSVMPVPRTADEQVNFVVHHAFMSGMRSIVAQVEAQVKQYNDRMEKETTNAARR